MFGRLSSHFGVSRAVYTTVVLMLVLSCISFANAVPHITSMLING